MDKDHLNIWDNHNIRDTHLNNLSNNPNIRDKVLNNRNIRDKVLNNHILIKVTRNMNNTEESLEDQLQNKKLMKYAYTLKIILLYRTI